MVPHSPVRFGRVAADGTTVLGIGSVAALMTLIASEFGRCKGAVPTFE